MCTTFRWPVHIDIPLFLKHEAEEAIAKQKEPTTQPTEDVDSSKVFANTVDSSFLPMSRMASQLQLKNSVAASLCFSVSAAIASPMPPKTMQKWPNSRNARRNRDRSCSADEDDFTDAELLYAFELLTIARAKRGLLT